MIEGRTFLIVPKEDITISEGEQIAALTRINVPTTKKPYQKGKI